MEFVEFGDMDMMLQYLKDVQAVQRKISELSETIEFINEVLNTSLCCQRLATTAAMMSDNYVIKRISL